MATAVAQRFDGFSFGDANDVTNEEARLQMETRLAGQKPDHMVFVLRLLAYLPVLAAQASLIDFSVPQAWLVSCMSALENILMGGRGCFES